MPTDLSFTHETLAGFLFVLARIGSAFVLIPIPGARAASGVVKVVIVLSLTLALAPLWPRPQGALLPGRILLWMISEATLGLAIGLLVAFVNDIFTFAAQTLSVQAGFSYATAIDPTSEADSGVLQILATIGSNLLFFQAGGEAMVLRALGRSLEAWPPGSVHLPAGVGLELARLGSMMTDLGLHFALPVAALLLLSDFTLALLGRLNSQLQLLTLSFPVKMLASLLILAGLCGTMPALYRQGLDRASGLITRLVTAQGMGR